MKRKRRRKLKLADGIFTADLHFRDTKPVARTDDYILAQWMTLLEICALQEKHKCGVYVAGDFLDHWKPSPWLLSQLITRLPEKWFTIYGDHDIPNKNMRLIEKSGLFTLWKAGKVKILGGGHGTDKNNHKLGKYVQPSVVIKGRKILLWHILTWKKDLPFPGCENKSARQLLKIYPQFDCIVTGDNHKPFTESFKGRMLVNCGSMMQMKADQINYKPAVWLYYAKQNKVVPYYLKTEDNVISREHLNRKNEADKRIDTFVKSLNTKIKLGMSFEQNMTKFLKNNDVKPSIVKTINKYM